MNPEDGAVGVTTATFAPVPITYSFSSSCMRALFSDGGIPFSSCPLGSNP